MLYNKAKIGVEKIGLKKMDDEPIDLIPETLPSLPIIKIIKTYEDKQGSKVFKKDTVQEVTEELFNNLIKKGIGVKATLEDWKEYHKQYWKKKGESIAQEIKQDKIKVTASSILIDNYMRNVEMFYEKQPFFYDLSGIFWFWKSNRYEQVDDIDVMNMLDDTLGFMGQTVNSKLKNNYLEAFKRIGRKKIPKDAPSKWVQFKDKAFSIGSGKIYPVEPNFFFTNPIPWELSDSDATPTLDKLFEEWVGKEYVDILYELIAYCCYTDYPIQLLFCLVGCGRNGKGCFLKVLDKFLGGDINVTSTSLDLISGNNKSRFESFRLYKKLVALMGETNFDLLTNTSLLKQLTGGDKIGFEKKGKDPFTGYNYAKIIIASNSLPTTQDTSDGFFRRWFIIDFPNEFPEGKDITKSIPEQEYTNLTRKVVNILPKLLENGCFTKQGDIQERKTKYMVSSNPLPLFISNCCITSDLEFISYNEMYTSYIKLLRVLKKRRISRKEFKTALEDEGFWIEKTAKSIKDQWVSGLFISGVNIVLENLEFFTKNPTQFLICENGVGKVVKNSKNSKNQDNLYEEEYIQQEPQNINPPETALTTKESIINYIRCNPLITTNNLKEGLKLSQDTFVKELRQLETKGDIMQSKPDRWKVLE